MTGLGASGASTQKARRDSDRDAPTGNHHQRAIILISVAALLLASILYHSSKGLPFRYALCSRKGKVYTVDESRPQTECIVVHGKKIVDLGTIGEIRKRWGEKDRTGPVSSNTFFGSKTGIDILYTHDSHVIVPGLTDAHAHVIELGFKKQLPLDGTLSKEDVIERIKNYVLSDPDVLYNTSIWIRGWGWDQTRWKPTHFPTADDFESEPLLRGRPISLKRVDGHSLWVSNTVLESLGPLPDYVEGGEIVRDASGKASGIFIDNAQGLVQSVQPEWTEKQLVQYFSAAAQEIVSFGLTSIHDAATTPQMIRFFKRMADERKMPIRLYLMGNIESYDYWGDQIERFLNYGPDARLTLRSIKLFADGALGSWGAALMKPYLDKPTSKGLLLAAPDVLANLIRRYWDDGFQVNVHCIGDRANKLVLDVFEDMVENRSTDFYERRPRIEHAQIIDPVDLARFGRLNVIPSVQPTHATSDMWYAENRLGPERIKHAYAYRSLLNSSSHHVLPLGSDFPVEGVNPLLGFYAAVSRLSVEGGSPHGNHGWFPQEKLTRLQALKGMTLDPAYASFNENHLGTLTPGKLADYVVLDTDIMTAELPEILSTKVVATVIDGRPVYGKLR